MIKNINVKKLVIGLTITAFVSFGALGVLLGVAGPKYFLATKEGSAQKTINEEKTFNMENLKEINIKTAAMDVHFIPVDTNEVKLRLYGEGVAYDPNALPYLDTKVEQDRLYAEVKQKPISFSFGFLSMNEKLEVYIPKTYAQDIRVETLSGNVYSDEINANNFIQKSASGNVEIKSHKTQNTRLETAAGNYKVDGFTGNLKFKSLSGHLDISYDRFDNNIDFESASGELNLRLPQEAQFYLKAVSLAGNFSSDFPVIKSEQPGRNSAEGIVGSDKNRITVSTASGDVRILKK